MATSTPVTTQQLILPKPKAPQPVPLIFVPVNITLTNGLCNNERGQISLIARTIPSAPPPLPPPSLLKQCRRRIPILIDQKSIKKNLQLNKQTLQTKLLHRPESSQLIERGILRSEEEKLRRFQHRENIRSHIEKRPTRETLVTQGILLSNACVDPLIQVRGQLLKRNKLVDNLNSKLRKRPGPLELVNRKILQVDAELEQAVQEGRLPFTPTLSSPSSSTFGETTITTEMISTIIPPLQIRHEEQQYSSSSSSSASATTTSVSQSSTVGPKAKIRKKSQQLHRTPYDNTSINTNKIIKLKSIANGKRSTNESIGSLETSSTTSNLSTDFSNSNGISPMETDDIHSDNIQSETNYEINLKQQQIYLQWQEDHHHETNVITPAMSSTTSNCSTPLQSNDTPSIHSTRSSFSVSSAHSGNHGNTRFLSLYSPSVSPTQINETTTLQIPIIESEKPKSKLADFKVQDLKNECKKRQLPVSGAKPQLLERLKPYEDYILATLSPSNGTTILSKSSNITIPSAVECNETSPSAGTCQNSCGHQQQHQQQQSIYCQTKPLLPAQDVITDYLQQCQPQKSQQKPLVLQLPPNSKPPQLVQLVDSNGTVVGVAAMPQQTITPTKPSVPCCCAQCKKQPGSHISTIAETVVQTKSHESKLNEPTFSFSQMGSGGQFTLANSSPVVSECRQMSQNCAGCIAAASQSAIQIVSSELSSTNPSRSSVATVQAPSNSSHNLCTAPPLIRSNTSSTMSSTLKKSHIVLQKSESNSSTVEQTVAAVAHRRHSIPATVFSHNEDLSDKILSPDQICQIPSPNVQILSTQDDENDTNLDEIDPNVLMTAKTFSQHEENLRIQQRLIEDLQAELAKSQEQLRREQKLIIAAKRLQLRTDQQTGKQCTQAEILLNNLDIKQINKHHIQHFIQHKSQQQSVQSQSNDYQQLLQVEQKLQEELHMEQAVQDIVRLIKQDGRTALLIVQLLRRYQLERNHQLQQADAVTQQQKQSNDKISIQRTTAASTISGQNELTPGSIQQQQECSGRTSVMSGKSITNENIVDTCCQQLSHQPQNVESCCKNRTCLNQQQKSAQIVVIDDSPASSPAPVINVPTVGETLQKQKETTQRSKSQNPRTNKRKNNGSRSIWAKTNLIEKSASFTNANSTSATPSKVVDMEEIFRTVINDTSDSRETPLLATSTIDTSHQQSQKSQPLHQQQKITNMDASSELVPQLNGFHLVANSDDSSNSAIADDHMDHTSSYQHVLNPSNGYSQEYVVSQQPMLTEICSTTAIFIQPENISSCHVDCYSKPRNENSPERVEIIGNGHEYIQTTNIQQFEYAKNEDFDDLMDVLRDDQECINGHMTEDGNCGREILGYTSAELATFLAADENIVNNGNIYETFVPTQGQEHYQTQNYQQHCIQQQQQTINNITYENQGNIEYEITAGNLGQHSTLHIEPHQEQAIDDILNNSDMMEPSVEWFDNYFQSPITERQMTACGSRPPNGTNIHRPMDTFV
jgi:hypothetical protein